MDKNPAVFHNEEVPLRELFPGADVRFIHSAQMTLAEWFFKPKTELPEHSHPHEQISKILSGKFELIVESKSIIMTNGDCVVIPPHAVHSGKAITDCHIIDVFHPVREEYR